MKRFFFLLAGSVFFIAGVYGQDPVPTPPGERLERVITEEIVLNVAAFDRAGSPSRDLRKEDLVITEDGRLHQANSIRRIPASVLIAMDTGGEIRQKKNITTTRQVAGRLIETLAEDSKIALMQFHDRTDFLSEWSADKAELLRIVGSRTNFGRRASFTSAMTSAIGSFATAPTDNRHLILITDGLDSTEDTENRAEVLKQAWKSGIVVHIISYTQIEFEALKPQARIWRKGEHKPRRMPDEVMEALIDSLPMRRQDAEDFVKQVYQPRLLSIVTDLPLLKSRRSQLRALTASHTQLSALAEYTGGTILLPESLIEMSEKAASIARSINAQYVVSYEPRRPLEDVTTEEVRKIEVTSRNPDVQVVGSRRLIVYPNGSDSPD